LEGKILTKILELEYMDFAIMYMLHAVLEAWSF